MKTAGFTKKLKQLLEESGDFVTDTIDMRGHKKAAKKKGFDDVIFVAGDIEDETYVIYIQTISPLFTDTKDAKKWLEDK